MPGCGDRIRAAPAQGEQPDPITLRCGYCWLKGSMMLFEYSETSQLVLLLPLWYFKVEFLLIICDISWALKYINPYSINRRKHVVTQDKTNLAFVMDYYDIFKQSFLLR